MPRIRVKSIKIEGNSLEVVVENEDYTVLAPLLTYLLQDPDVEYATYTIDHPLLRNAVIRVRTRGSKDPVKAIEDAVNKILADIDSVSSQLKSQLGLTQGSG